jgi:hypothetical protein
MQFAKPIEEGDSSDVATIKDLKELSTYLIEVS